VHEHTYTHVLFSVGWCILVVVGLQRLWRSPKLRPLLISLLLLLLFSFSVKTIARNSVWSSREALFRWACQVKSACMVAIVMTSVCRSALATVPSNGKVFFNYANYLKDSGRGQEAIQYYRTAIR